MSVLLANSSMVEMGMSSLTLKPVRGLASGLQNSRVGFNTYLTIM
ncbi:MAG TPA: hypothetical protein VFU29_22625 [Chitinophagaceae bacterium]|nr:hypothetical protein [Chitinophagaceae bacterium]